MKTVLVIDDEFAIAELLEAVLAEHGYRVVTAANGRQGLDRLAELRPDLVLVDFMMPILDGPGMVRAMREDPTLRSVPIIVMSAVAEAAARDRLDGYAAFVQKPFRIARILQLAVSLIGKGDARTS